MKKLLVSIFVLGATITAATLLGVFGSGKDGVSGTGNIVTDIETGDISIGDISVVAEVATVRNTTINQFCSEGAICSAEIGAGALNAVGDMYAIDLGFSPLSFGMIEQEKYIIHPFKNGSDTAYFTYMHNGIKFEVVLALLSYNKADYTPEEFAMLSSVIQNEIVASKATINSGVKMLLRKSGNSDLWLEVMHIELVNKVKDFANNNLISAVGVSANGLPFVMLENVSYQGQTFPGIELKIQESVIRSIAPMTPVMPMRSR